MTYEAHPARAPLAAPIQSAVAPAAAERIRVLLFVNSVAMGGMERHVELLARHLDRRRVEVFALCPDWAPSDALRRTLADLADHVAIITPDNRAGRWRQITETMRFLRQMRAWKIQVMHAHSTTYRGQVVAYLAARLAGVRRIYVTEHLAPDAPVPPRERWLRNLYSRVVDGIVCVSEKNRRARADHLYTPAARTLVVNNGIDLDDFPPTPPAVLADLRRRHQIPPTARVVGTAVRFEPEKGLSDLLDAMPAVRAACPDVHLLMVGDGSLRADLEAQAAALGLADIVHFVGFQSDPRPYLGLMDTFVLPVPVGSMSIGLLEAMAMERAVVITFGGAGEAVVHGESGLCAEPRDPRAIAAATIQILTNPTLQAAYGAAARRRVADAFSARRVARILEQLYAGPHAGQAGQE